MWVDLSSYEHLACHFNSHASHAEQEGEKEKVEILGFCDTEKRML